MLASRGAIPCPNARIGTPRGECIQDSAKRRDSPANGGWERGNSGQESMHLACSNCSNKNACKMGKFAIAYAARLGTSTCKLLSAGCQEIRNDRYDGQSCPQSCRAMALGAVCGAGDIRCTADFCRRQGAAEGHGRGHVPQAYRQLLRCLEYWKCGCSGEVLRQGRWTCILLCGALFVSQLEGIPRGRAKGVLGGRVGDQTDGGQGFESEPPRDDRVDDRAHAFDGEIEEGWQDYGDGTPVYRNLGEARSELGARSRTSFHSGGRELES